MICARCDQPIEPGHTYHQARVRSTSDAPGVCDPIVYTHDECPASQQWTFNQERCLNSGGHYWNQPEPGDNAKCTVCSWTGARNWPVINQCNEFAEPPTRQPDR